MDKVIKAIPLDDYCIDIVTSSGVCGVFDVKPYLNGGAFQQLRDKNYFSSVRPAHHGIAWPNEQDFSSDTIIHDILEAQSRLGLSRCA
ncbi:MAG: DUF2442 domain-containing protein [Halothiobacillaceae bacterium]|nr:DUF2442 domain-containing protein [Halothiobacillaceae bacterium]